mmetsp:Transcript_32546/g.51804  ORF Transcript_32546/g.51804 Transcript_32546/m.51804 type:complete len:1551 (-) Transcript_32546:315-4967(-)|eukprot:CAMPEP_0203743682 /NCGR_PEP_ID=MMETSP0098-20131031/10_1 /ASSEMBLY_ACC=CAM_ASM_000208 /TAXON_ID=96639 /ORGANISM=" , Strain NY0313808BC1" /LENGTH=1550 /DNA_ID=CAMNT_0050630995 /DNA_START=1759 /DNA_END=6411 /DNA_ORIENTATION=-
MNLDLLKLVIVSACLFRVSESVSCDCKNRSKTRLAFVGFGDIESNDQLRVQRDGFNEAGKVMRFDTHVFLPTNLEIKYEYSNSLAAAFSANLQKAMELDPPPQGIVVSTADLEAASAELKALSSSIVVVAVGSGQRQVKNSSLTNLYRPLHQLGVDEYQMGEQAGNQAGRLGSSGALCIVDNNQEVALKERCDGFRKGFLDTCPGNCTMTILNLGGFILESAVITKINEGIQSDTSNVVDLIAVSRGKFALYASKAMKANEALTARRIVSFVVDDTVNDMLDDNEITFAIDRQDYLASFMGTVLLGQGVSTGQKAANDYLETGPVVVASRLKSPTLKVHDLHLELIVHGSGFDGFWLDFKKGSIEAARDLRIPFWDCGKPSVTCNGEAGISYRAPPNEFDLTTMSKEILTASEYSPDGLILSIPNWDALQNAITTALKDRNLAGVSVNAGGDIATSVGMLAHFGQEEVIAGTKAGEKMCSSGAKKALFLNHEKGNSALDQRAAGFIEGMKACQGAEEVLLVFADRSSFKNDVLTLVSADADINALQFAGSIGDFQMIYEEITAAGLDGRNIRIGMFDVLPQVVEEIMEDRILFTIQQQQQMQAFVPSWAMALRALTGQMLKTSWFLTGPALVTKENALMLPCQHELTCPLEVEYDLTGATCPLPNQTGDGWCDPVNNIDACGYDGGDCCEETCESSTSFSCNSDRHNSGLNRFDCLDRSTQEGLARFCSDNAEHDDCLEFGQRSKSLLKIGLLLQLSEGRIKSSSECDKAGLTWFNNSCILGEDWKALTAVALLAVKHFNERNATYIPSLSKLEGCNKVMTGNIVDSKSSTAGSIQGTMDLATQFESDIIIGPLTSPQNLRTALLSGVYKVPQISYGATSKRLEDRASYPYFSRTLVSEEMNTKAVCKLWRSFEYRFGAIVYPDTEDGDSYRGSLLRNCAVEDIQIYPFVFTPGNPESQDLAIEKLDKSDINIVIFVGSDHSMVTKILTYDGSRVILGAGTSWIFSEFSFSKMFPLISEDLGGDTAKRLSGSMFVKPIGGSFEIEAFSKFRQDWDTFNVTDYMYWLPEHLRFDPIPIFQNFDSSNDWILQDLGAYLYDAIVVAGLLSCHVANEIALDKNSFADSFRSSMSELSIQGLSGALQFSNTPSGNRNEIGSTISVSKIDQNGVFTKVAALRENIVEITDLAKLSIGNGIISEGIVANLSDVVLPEQDYGYSSVVKGVCVGFCIFNCVVAFLGLLAIFKWKQHPVMKAAQFPFLVLICLGAVTSSLTIIPIVTDDEGAPANEKGGNSTADVMCMAQVWFFAAGFVLTFTPLFVKLRRVKQIFLGTFKTAKSNSIKTSQLVKLILAFAGIEFAIVLAWTIASPLEFVRTPTAWDRYGNVIASSGQCTSEHSTLFLVLMALAHLGLLGYGALLCYQTTGVNTAYSEAKYVSVALISNLEMMLLCIPVLLIVAENSKMNMFVRAGVVFLNDLSILLVMMAPKLLFILRGTQSEGLGADVLKVQISKSKSKGASVSPYSTNNNTSCALATSNAGSGVPTSNLESSTLGGY